jgi:hypothetical protein
MQAEKAAFDEEEKKREEEVLSLPIYPWQFEMLKSISTILLVLVYFFLCSFLTFGFDSLPGSKGGSS